MALLQTHTMDSSERLKSLRQRGWEHYTALPWPTNKEEEWRRTDPEKFRLTKELLAKDDAGFQVQWEPLSPELIHAGVILTNLKTALKQFPELMEQYLFQTGTPEGLKKFVALHQARWSDGLFCYVPEGVHVELPLKAWMEIAGESSTLFPHSLIVVDHEAQVTLIEERRSSGRAPASAFSNEMVEIVLKENANLWYIHLQEWSPSVSEILTQRAILEREAQFFNLTVGLGGLLTKANIETVLQGTGGRSELLGILCGTGNQHFDFHTLQDHQARQTFSDLLYKSALKDSSQSIYTGLIRIRKEAQKSDAYQANRNLLLSQGAKADSIPMLEIEADDVRCTHGVAVGPVDEEQAFYLMSRGIPPLEAEHVIVDGFFEQIFKRLPVESLREEWMAKVTRRVYE